MWRASSNTVRPLAVHPQALGSIFTWQHAKDNERLPCGVAIVHIEGPLNHHSSWEWDSYDDILDRVEGAMTGDDVVAYDQSANWWKDGYTPVKHPGPAKAVVLRIDSPGGEAAGATYCHRKLKRLRALYDVPLYTFADEMACSAAYEIACAADEIWLPDTGVVGSIGVIATMFDRTKANAMDGMDVRLITSGDFKSDGHADRVLTDDIVGRTQNRVYELANVFWSIVAAARGTTPKAVAGLQAGTFCGQVAVDVGVADGVCDWDRFQATLAASLKQDDDSDNGADGAATESDGSEKSADAA